MSLMPYFYVAVGGGLGAMARYGVSAVCLSLLGSGFPYATMLVNVLGSFLMGVCIEIFASIYNPGGLVQVMITTGFLGAFTTFSTFSLDFMSLYQRGDMMHAFGYLLLSVVLSIVALFMGLYFIRIFNS